MVGKLIPFQEHIELTHPRVRQLEMAVFIGSIVAGVSFSSAIFGKEVLPIKLRSGLLLTASFGAIAAVVSGEGLRKAQQQYKPYEEAQRQILADQNATTTWVEETRQKAIAAREAVQAVLDESPSPLFTAGFLENVHLDGISLLQILTGGKAQQDAMSQPVVDTVATEAPSLKPESKPQPTKPTYPGAAIAPNYAAMVRSPLEKIPEENLALTLAKSTTDPSCATSVFIAAPRRCGKSNLVRQAIVYANDLHNTNIDFNVWNAGKDDEDYCGLQNSDMDYLFTAHPNNLSLAVRLMNGSEPTALVRRCDRWMGHPTLLVADEWNNTLSTARTADSLERGSAMEKQLIAGSAQIVTRGPGKLVLGWFTSHSGYVKNIGWDTDILKNISCIALARIGKDKQGQTVKYGETMKQALQGGNGKTPWIDDPDTLAEMQNRFREWFDSDECAVVALTNLLGEWRLIRLPQYPDNHPPIERSILNQSVAEVVAPSTPNGVYDQLKAGLSPSPSVSEVQQLWQQITGSKLPTDAAQEVLNGIQRGII